MTKRSVAKLLTIIIAFFTVLAAPAQTLQKGSSVTVNNLNYTILTMPDGEQPGTVETKAGSNYNNPGNKTTTTNVTIPEQITVEDQNFTVTGIGNYSFTSSNVPGAYKQSITKVTLPSTLTYIGTEAFRGTGLTSVTIPASVTEFKNSVFNSCSSLATVTFEPGSVLTKMGTNTFGACSKLKAIALPSGLTTIPSNTFSGCTMLTSATLPSNITLIGSAAFNSCSSLTEITIPSGVTTIGNDAFKNCSKLAEYHGGSGVTSIGSSAFSGTALTSFKLQTPTSPYITSLGKNAFANCKSLTTFSYYSTTPVGADPIFSTDYIPETINLLLSAKDKYLALGAWADLPEENVVWVGLTVENTSYKLNVGETALISASATGAGRKELEVTYKSYNTSVVTVADGELTAVAPGSANVMVSAIDPSLGGNFSHLVSVTVMQPATGITLDKEELNLIVGGEESDATATLKATVTPDDADPTVTWTSSNTNVAVVTADGVVTAVNVGTATITATTSNGLSAKCTVTVTDNTSGIRDIITAPADRNSKIFDLQGRRLKAITAPGVYIIDGRQVLVR